MEGFLADKIRSLILDALSRAAAEPDGLPLLGGKSGAGLFPSGAAGKQAALQGKAEGLLRVLRVQTKGKSAQEICAVTDKGLALLLDQANPRLVLEALVAALQTREQQMNTLLDGARASQQHLQSLRVVAEKILQQLSRPPSLTASAAEKNGKHETDAAAALLARLVGRHRHGALDDCPLPELWRHVRTTCPALTLGQFHDLLRRLHEARKIYLHPWTGPLYELPEPACSLLVGHEVAYYASAVDLPS
jgi:hypothetical protein